MKSPTQIVIIISIAVLAASVLLILDIHRASKDEVVHRFYGNQTLIVRQLAQEVERNLRDRSRGIQVFSTFASVQHRDMKKMSVDIQEYFQYVNKNYVKAISVYDENGTIINSTTEGAIGRKYANCDFFLWAARNENKGGSFISTVIRGTENQTEQVPHFRFIIATPVYQKARRQFRQANPRYPKPADKFVGVLTCTVDLEEAIAAFLPLVTTNMTKEHVWILDTNGTVLFQSEHPEMVLKNIRRRDETCLRCHASLDYVEKVLAEKQGTIEYALKERAKKLACFALITFENAAWIIAVNAPLEEVSGFLERQLVQIFLLIGLITVALVGAAALIYRSNRSKIRAQEEARQWKEKRELEDKIRKSEEQYRQLVDISPDAIAVHCEGKIVFVNPAAVRLLGATGPDNLIGKHALEIVHPGDREIAKQRIAKMFEGGESVPVIEERFLRMDGSIVYVEVVAAPTTYQGKPAVQVVIRDITGRKRAKEAIHTLSYQNKLILDSLGEGIYGVDVLGKATFVNPAAATMTGYSTEELLGRPMHEILHHSKPDGTPYPREECPIYAAFKDGTEHRVIDEVFWRKDGTSLPVEYVSTPIQEQDKLIGAVVVFKDITERKRAEEQLRLSEMTYRGIIDSTSDAIYIQDENGFFLDVNLAAEKMYGFPRNYFINKTPEFLSAPGKNDLAATAKAIHDAFHGMAQHFEFWGLHKDGSIFPKEVILTPGTYFGQKAVIAVARDITERKRAEEAVGQSESLFRSVWENSKDGMRLTDANGRIVRVNRGFCDFVKKQREELEGNSLVEIYAESERELILSAYLENYSSSEIKPYLERKFKLWNGKEVWFAVTNALLDSRGIPPLVLSIFRDISERKEAEEALRTSEEKYRKLINQINDGLLVVDNDDAIQFVNEKLCAMVGYMQEELIGKIGYRILLPEGSWNLLQEKNLLRKQGMSETYDLEMKKKSGERFWVSVSASPIYDLKGDVVGSTAVISDITERTLAKDAKKSLEAQLQQAQKFESLGTLASGIAHDFNNILGIILGYSSLIERTGRDPQSLSQSAQAINKAVHRGANLVSQILTFARKTDVLVGPVDLNMMIKELFKMLEETFAKKIELSLQLGKDIPLINADATQVHQVLLNLSVNARDAMSSSGTLTFKTEVVKGSTLRSVFPNSFDGGYVHLSVSDTGIGMDERTRSQIFDPFFTTKEKGKGTGLGLSVVYGVMKNHDGFIDVQSEVGKGATFNLYFPVPKEGMQATVEQMEARQAIPGGNETLLVVEDEAAMLAMMKEVLEVNGYRVLAVQDGIQALRVYQKHKDEIALVLTDIGLPKISGDQLFHDLKKLNPSIRVILASGFIEPNTKSEILKAGVRYFIQKPYNLNEVLRAVRKVLDS